MAQIPPILVTCNCGYMLHAPAEYAGHQMQCPNCGDPVRIPATLAPKPTPAYNPNKSSPTPWIILGIVAALLIGVIVYALVKKGNEPQEISGTGGSGKPNPTSNGGDANGDVAGLLEWPSEFSPLQPGSIEPTPTYPHDPDKLATPFPVEGEFIRSAPIINDGLTAAIEINDGGADRFDFYQLDSGEKIASISKPDRDSKILDLAPEGGRVAISSDGEISIFELPSTQRTHKFQPVSRPNAVISYGRFLGDRRLFLYGERSRIFGLWNLSLKRFDWAHRLPGNGNTPVAISPDWKLVWAATDQGILAFDLVNGAPPEREPPLARRPIGCRRSRLQEYPLYARWGNTWQPPLDWCPRTSPWWFGISRRRASSGNLKSKMTSLG